MPNKPKKIKRSWKPERVPFARPRDLSWFYNQTKWRKLAKARKEKYPLCRACKEKGIISPNEVTDHIRGLGYLLDNNLDPFKATELDDLCHRCHNRKSARETSRIKGIRGLNR